MIQPSHSSINITTIEQFVAPPQRLQVRQGIASALAHHGEILQGIFPTRAGTVQRGLVTLPCGMFRSHATFTPLPSSPITVEPEFKTKARRAVMLLLQEYGIDTLGGHLVIHSDVPLRWGMGSSTCDITAALRAAAHALMIDLSANEIARLAVQAEQASDSIMFNDGVVLFAHRDGQVLEDLGGKLPALEVVGFNTDPSGEGIDTLKLRPAAYSWWEIEAFRPLLGLLRRAIQTQDPRLVGQVASASARINQRHVQKPHFDQLEALVEQTQALGLQVAHSGTIVGVLFDPRDCDKHEKIKTTRAAVAALGFGACWHFQTNYPAVTKEYDS